MYVSYYKGSQAFVSYHGSTDQYARRMQVMIDGRSVYLPPVSAVDWADLPITVDDIERIEVIRGPAAASHGANSTQGVISITTRAAGGVNGKQVSFTRGSKGINDVSARFGQTGELFDYRMTLAYSADNGYDDLTTPPNGMTLATPRAPDLLNNGNDSNQARLMNFRGDYHPNAADSFDIQLGFNRDVQGVGFSDKNPTPSNPGSTNGNTPHDLVANSSFMHLGWTRQLDTDSELNLLYYHIRQQRHEAFPVYLGGTYFPGPVVQSLSVQRDEISMQHTLRTSADNRLVYGAAYREDRTRGLSDIPPLALTFSAAERMDEWRIFAHDEWRATSVLLINGGAMWERDRMGRGNISPRLAFNLTLQPQHTLRIGTSVAYRTPALVEEKFPAIQPGDLIIPSATVTSPNLRPERIVSREIGYLGQFSEGASSIDLRLYSDVVSGVIYPQAGAFVNQLTARHQGFEATFKHTFDVHGNLSVNFARASAHSDAQSLGIVSQLPGDSDAVSASIPRNSASVLYSKHWDNALDTSIAYYYQGSLQPFDRGSMDYQPIQRRVDVRMAKSFRNIIGVNGDLSLVVQNLLNQDYTEYIANNVFNRRAYVTLTLKW
jgi:iron complex outermembrane receptor protein